MRGIVGVVVVGLMLLAGCVEKTDGPDWAPGTSFTHEFGAFDQGSATVWVDGAEVSSESDGSLDPRGGFVVSLEVVGTHDDVFLSKVLKDDTWFALGFRAEDLRPLPTRVLYGPGCATGATCASKATEIVFEPAGDAAQWLDFPLSEGKTWDHSVRNADPAGPPLLHVTASVGKEHMVDGPNGPVKSIPIVHRIHVDDDEQLAANLRAALQNLGFTEAEAEVDVEWSVRIEYAPSLGNIVERVVLLTTHVEAQATLDGSVLSGVWDATSGTSERLSQARLRNADEPSWSDMLATFDEPHHPGVISRGYTLDQTFSYRPPSPMLPVDVPQAPEPEPGVTRLQVTADADHVNSHPGTDVSFSVEGGLPEGATAVYHVHDAEGRAIVEGRDLSTPHLFDEPGRFLITVEAWEDGLLTGEGSTRVVADHIRSEEPTCSVVVALAIGSCERVEVPVRPGIERLTIQLTPGTLASPQGELVLRDPAGNVWTAATTTSGGSLVLEDWDGVDVDQGDWTVQYRPLAEALGAPQIDLHLEYGRATDPSAAPGVDAGAQVEQTLEEVLAALMEQRHDLLRK